MTMSSDPQENLIIKIIAIPLMVLIGIVGFVGIGIGAPVMFVGGIIQIYARFVRDGAIDFYSLVFLGVAVLSGYVAWWFWTSFITTAVEWLKGVKKYFSRNKTNNEKL